MNKRNSSLIAFISGIVLLLWNTGCINSNQKKKRNEVSSEKNTFVNNVVLDSFFTELNTRQMFNGAVAVKKNGELIFKKGYGIANLEKETDFLPATTMEIASLSKQFTAAAILLLQQDGKLEIDHPVTDYLGSRFPYPDITIKHLLTHTSGLPDYEKYFRKEWDSSEIVSNKDILEYFKNEKPELMSVPGEKYHYSNSGYVMLAVLVKEITDQELDSFLEERIFKIADMDHTGFYDRDAIWTADNYAPGYMRDIRTCSYVKPDSLPGRYYYRFLSGRLGPGRLSSSVDDLIKWDSILYTDKILNKSSKELAFKPHPPTKDNSDYGFGWHIPEDDSLTVAYHTGSWAGNLTYIKRYLNSRDLVIILNNTHNSPFLKEIRASVDDYLKGGSLTIPKMKAHILLEQEICDLDKTTILKWKEDHTAIEWDREQLEKLNDKYLVQGLEEKAEIVSILLKNFD